MGRTLVKAALEAATLKGLKFPSVEFETYVAEFITPEPGPRITITPTEKEKVFLMRAIARNIPEGLAMNLVYWQRLGAANLDSFFD